MRRSQEVLVAHGAPQLPAGYTYYVYPLDDFTICVELQRRLVWGLFWRVRGVACGPTTTDINNIAGLCKMAHDDWQRRMYGVPPAEEHPL